MARNAEKAMTTLARWRAAQMQENAREKARRPYLATECNSLHKCIKWRAEIIGEISVKVSQIQNAGLGEYRIRDLNDEINKLLREKGHWETQIKDLGGADYTRKGIPLFDNDGKEVPGNKGYKYFGAAKELPGVKDLFEQEPPLPTRKNRPELMKEIDADYYGYRDDDDGLLIPSEEEEERKARAHAIEMWNIERQNNPTSVNDDSDSVDEESNDVDIDSEQDTLSRFVAHVAVPTQEQIKEALLLRKKQVLLEKYAS